MTTEALRKAFAQKLSLKMLLDINQLKKTIRNGIEQGTWVYFDSNAQRGYGKGAPPPPVHISEDTMLYTPEEAKRHIELCRKLRDPNLSGEEMLKLREELEALGPGLALGAVWSTYLWFPLPGQEEPPDSEAIVIDLRDF